MQRTRKCRQAFLRHPGAAQACKGKTARIHRMHMRMHDAAAQDSGDSKEQISVGRHHIRDAQHP